MNNKYINNFKQKLDDFSNFIQQSKTRTILFCLIVLFLFGLITLPFADDSQLSSANTFNTIENALNDNANTTNDITNDFENKTPQEDSIENSNIITTPIANNNAVSTENNNTVSENKSTYKVVKVVDGDTIKIMYNGNEESVRMIGIDTPESVHPDEEKNTEFGNISSNFTKSYLENKEVTLEFDVQERDQYGRLLAYVYIGEKMYNKILLEEGYAQVSTYPPNVKYVNDFTAIQEQAKIDKKGLWSYKTTSNNTQTNTNTSSSSSTTNNSSTTTSITSSSTSNSSSSTSTSVSSSSSSTTSSSSSSTNIETNSQTVYKSKTGSKYHYSSSCSNMKSPSEITLSEAENQGLEPCKKCT